jgi:IrrE N-terminal-like domain
VSGHTTKAHAKEAPPRASSSAIEEICRELLIDVPVRPTQLAVVARKLGVASIREERGLPYSGVLRRRTNGRLEIRYAPSGRARFTIAHELGHAYLLRSEFEPLDEESFCDRFAAELLMPAKLMYQEVSEELTIERLQDMKRAFHVSLHSISVRCAQFTCMGALLADRRGLLWRAGEVRRLDPGLTACVADALAAGGPLVRQLSRRRRGEQETWHLEAEPLPRRPTDVLLMLRPVRMR